MLVTQLGYTYRGILLLSFPYLLFVEFVITMNE